MDTHHGCESNINNIKQLETITVVSFVARVRASIKVSVIKAKASHCVVDISV